MLEIRTDVSTSGGRVPAAQRSPDPEILALEVVKHMHEQSSHANNSSSRSIVLVKSGIFGSMLKLKRV